MVRVIAALLERSMRGARREAAVLIMLMCAQRDSSMTGMADAGSTDEEVEAYRQATDDLRDVAREWAA